METALGLLGFALFIVGVISLAAGVSWVVVKLTPPPKSGPGPSETSP